MHTRALVVLTLLAGLVLWPDWSAGRGAEPAQATAVEAQHGMVVSVSPEASDVGLSVLQNGGNAVDAAVATALALAVTYPQAGNIGGGGFMLVWPGAKQSPVCVDYRETAPAASTPEMFAIDRAPTRTKPWACPARCADSRWRIAAGANAPGASWCCRR